MHLHSLTVVLSLVSSKFEASPKNRFKTWEYGARFFETILEYGLIPSVKVLETHARE
jgi:hypothetical protein